jgi:ribonuclease VapC
MANVVLDASAVLALLNVEPGADLVTAALEDALVSTVNYAEVFSKLVEKGAPHADAKAALRIIEGAVADYDLDLAQRTGAMRSDTKSRGLSLADRACLALAERERLPALTGDRRWKGAVAGIEVRLIR